MDDTPMIPKQRGVLSRYVIAGLVFFGVVLVIFVGVVVISDATVKKPATSADHTTLEHVPESFSYINATAPLAYTIPCIDKGTPAGCDKTRVRTVTCNAVNTNGYQTITYDTAPACDSANQAITHAQTINVQFGKNADGTCLEITMKVGECWGVNPTNKANYECQGQCGAGCIKGCGLFSLGGSWSRNCLRHDVCSWYYGASGGGSDANCGKPYNQASGDLLKCSCMVSNPTCNI